MASVTIGSFAAGQTCMTGLTDFFVSLSHDAMIFSEKTGVRKWFFTNRAQGRPNTGSLLYVASLAAIQRPNRVFRDLA